jgi:hypothetical protein
MTRERDRIERTVWKSIIELEKVMEILGTATLCLLFILLPRFKERNKEGSFSLTFSERFTPFLFFHL